MLTCNLIFACSPMSNCKESMVASTVTCWAFKPVAQHKINTAQQHAFIIFE
jgi:hypothetical protein